MRSALLGLGWIVMFGVAGCFEAVPELNESQQVAEALTRGVRFDGGDVADGTLTESDAPQITLLAPSVPSVMSPGQVSLMGFETDTDDPATDPDFEATLMHFEGSKRHIRVGHADRFEGKTGHFEHNFEVDEDVCDDLCNKEHSVALNVALKLRDGRLSGRQRMNLKLDCRERGKASACGGKPAGMARDADDYERACQNTLEYCSADGFAEGEEVFEVLDPSECAAEYDCMKDFYGEGSECGDMLSELASCMVSIDAFEDCEGCYAKLSELASTCPEPSQCLGSEPSDRPDGGLVGPSPQDASVAIPPTEPLRLTDSLAENCRLLCDFSRMFGCDVSGTCEQDCEGGLVGTACEYAAVELQRCATQGQTVDDALACELTNPMVSAADMCSEQILSVTNCLIETEADPTPEPRADAGTPAP